MQFSVKENSFKDSNANKTKKIPWIAHRYRLFKNHDYVAQFLLLMVLRSYSDFECHLVVYGHRFASRKFKVIQMMCRDFENI